MVYELRKKVMTSRLSELNEAGPCVKERLRLFNATKDRGKNIYHRSDQYPPLKARDIS